MDMFISLWMYVQNMISFISASLGDEISGTRDLCSPLHPGTYRHKHVSNKWVVFGIEYLAVLITSKLKQDLFTSGQYRYILLKSKTQALR